MESKAIRSAMLTMFAAKIPNFVSEPSTPEQQALSSNILANLFGNIALVGSSASVMSYPTSVPCYNLESGTLSQSNLAGDPLNVAQLVMYMLAVRSAAVEPPLADLTLRQMCTPFAPEAYLFLRTAAKAKIYTSLARKMTRIGNKEPQVVFDFAKGLPLGSLTRSEASCIQVMHQRLFRTEGAKGVFDAQSQVGETSVEV
uniref:Coat protein n=1 Tax=Grapevine virus L TaxID=2283237 RepID=A0A499RDZ0_9VIRU|nr:coat protein [Grapevine virus L]QYA74822.1 coat protein [Grapevine virus L]QYA74920.1 coat protein [Grapevine virus L]QYA75198.1 coat protein [Grapevine virus L]QYA75242.1 coat protein [Grapevine virus L]